MELRIDRSKSGFLFKWAVWKETCDEPLDSDFLSDDHFESRVSSFRERAVQESLIFSGTSCTRAAFAALCCARYRYLVEEEGFRDRLETSAILNAKGTALDGDDVAERRRVVGCAGLYNCLCFSLVYCVGAHLLCSCDLRGGGGGGCVEAILGCAPVCCGGATRLDEDFIIYICVDTDIDKFLKKSEACIHRGRPSIDAHININIDMWCTYTINIDLDIWCICTM